MITMKELLRASNDRYNGMYRSIPHSQAVLEQQKRATEGSKDISFLSAFPSKEQIDQHPWKEVIFPSDEE